MQGSAGSICLPPSLCFFVRCLTFAGDSKVLAFSNSNWTAVLVYKMFQSALVQAQFSDKLCVYIPIWIVKNDVAVWTHTIAARLRNTQNILIEGFLFHRYSSICSHKLFRNYLLSCLLSFCLGLFFINSYFPSSSVCK